MKEKLIRYIRNFSGYFLLLFGIITALGISILSGILIMGVGALITVHSKKLPIKRKYKIILCLLLFISAVGLFPENTDQVKTSDPGSSKTVNANSTQNIKNKAKTSNIKIHFIDTGNSDCIFVQTKDKNLLIDAGDNDDEQRIVNYLNEQKITKINYLVSTHPDADHCGGLDAVVTNFNIDQSYVASGSSESKTYRDFIYALAAKGLTPAVPLEDTAISLDQNTQIKFYNTHAIGEGNELSLVTLLESGDHKMLFMGDATEKVEKNIINLLPHDIDILKVSHHGSKSATSEQFLKTLNIDYAVIECGKNNKYNHPDQQTLDRLKNHDIKTLRTDEKGNITFTIKNSKLSYKFSETTSDKGSAPVTKDPGDEIKKQHEEAVQQSHQETQTQAEPAQQTQQQDSTIVYIPQTGSKYHSNPYCSNMKNSSAVSLTEAQNRGYEPCKKCY